MEHSITITPDDWEVIKLLNDEQIGKLMKALARNDCQGDQVTEIAYTAIKILNRNDPNSEE